jgi:predicted AlkP superfamily pyrophosphatase or phosphodiesterase
LDQFRYDYLPRFEKYFGERGFNLFLKQGGNFVNAHYLHSQTLTAPGHAVIMSGTYPCMNGIIANKWYDPVKGEDVYCVGDPDSPLIGGFRSSGRSPQNFIGTTVGDQLRESNNGRSKVISISRKDRSAILMGGKMATAYWLVDSAYTTSTYYMEKLPDWVMAFNRSNRINVFRGRLWKRVLSEDEYTLVQGTDDLFTEQIGAGLARVFPHQIGRNSPKMSRSDFYGAFRKSPFESELLVEMAKQAVINENLGQQDVPDILCLSFAATDAVGHSYGPHSHEIMDLIIRTDRLLEDFFNFLDQKIGLENCAIVLTSDHGVMPMPEVLAAHTPNFKIIRVDDDDIEAMAEQAMIKEYGVLAADQATNGKENRKKKRPKYVKLAGARNIYFNLPLLQERNISVSESEAIVKTALERFPEMYAVYTRTELMKGQVSGRLGQKVLENFHHGRSGHVFFQMNPYVSFKKKDGTTHGSPWGYDSHVPMLWYLPKMKPGTYYQAVSIADIAPTLAVLLEVEFPASAQGKVLSEMFR